MKMDCCHTSSIYQVMVGFQISGCGPKILLVTFFISVHREHVSVLNAVII